MDFRRSFRVAIILFWFATTAKPVMISDELPQSLGHDARMELESGQAGAALPSIDFNGDHEGVPVVNFDFEDLLQAVGHSDESEEASYDAASDDLYEEDLETQSTVNRSYSCTFWAGATWSINSNAERFVDNSSVEPQTYAFLHPVAHLSDSEIQLLKQLVQETPSAEVLDGHGSATNIEGVISNTENTEDDVCDMDLDPEQRSSVIPLVLQETPSAEVSDGQGSATNFEGVIFDTEDDACDMDLDPEQQSVVIPGVNLANCSVDVKLSTSTEQFQKTTIKPEKSGLILCDSVAGPSSSEVEIDREGSQEPTSSFLEFLNAIVLSAETDDALSKPTGDDSQSEELHKQSTVIAADSVTFWAGPTWSDLSHVKCFDDNATAEQQINDLVQESTATDSPDSETSSEMERSKQLVQEIPSLEKVFGGQGTANNTVGVLSNEADEACNMDSDEPNPVQSSIVNPGVILGEAWADLSSSTSPTPQLFEDSNFKPSHIYFHITNVREYQPRSSRFLNIFRSQGISNKNEQGVPPNAMVGDEVMKWLNDREGDDSISAFDAMVARDNEGPLPKNAQSELVALTTVAEVDIPGVANASVSGHLETETQAAVQHEQESTIDISVVQPALPNTIELSEDYNISMALLEVQQQLEIEVKYTFMVSSMFTRWGARNVLCGLESDGQDHSPNG